MQVRTEELISTVLYTKEVCLSQPGVGDGSKVEDNIFQPMIEEYSFQYGEVSGFS